MEKKQENQRNKDVCTTTGISVIMSDCIYDIILYNFRGWKIFV